MKKKAFVQYKYELDKKCNRIVIKHNMTTNFVNSNFKTELYNKASIFAVRNALKYALNSNILPDLFSIVESYSCPMLKIWCGGCGIRFNSTCYRYCVTCSIECIYPLCDGFVEPEEADDFKEFF